MIKKTISFYINKGFLNTLSKIFYECKNLLNKRFCILINKKILKTKYGFYMHQNWNDVNFEWILYGKYPKIYLKYIQEIKSPFLFVDIGANLGMFSLSAAQNKFCEKVIAFEPVLQTFEELKKNTIINNFENKITLKNYGIADINGVMSISYDENHSGLSSLKYTPNKSSVFQEVKVLNAIELNKVISKSYKIIVKIDVEGYEEIVIKELIKCNFFEQIDTILYECHDKWTNRKKINNILKKNGFSKFEDIHKEDNKGNLYDVFASK